MKPAYDNRYTLEMTYHMTPKGQHDFIYPPSLESVSSVLLLHFKFSIDVFYLLAESLTHMYTCTENCRPSHNDPVIYRRKKIEKHNFGGLGRF